MSAYVLDTNVLIVAKGNSPQASEECVSACVAKLIAIQADGVIVIDSGLLILDEYRRYMSLSGQPTVGDRFFKWLWSIQADISRCEVVDIWPVDSDGNFASFPPDPRLAGFDRNDRKFVAVALSSKRGPVVLNAVDTDWAEYFGPLSSHGVKIQFLCPRITGVGNLPPSIA